MVSGHTTYLGCGGHHAERAERIVQQTFVHILVKVSNEQVCAHVQLLLVGGSLVMPNRQGHMRDSQGARRGQNVENEKDISCHSSEE